MMIFAIAIELRLHATTMTAERRAALEPTLFHTPAESIAKEAAPVAASQFPTMKLQGAAYNNSDHNIKLYILQIAV